MKPRDCNPRQGEQSCKRTERRTGHCPRMVCPMIYTLCAAWSSKWKAKEQLLFNCSKLLQNQLGYPKGYREGG